MSQHNQNSSRNLVKLMRLLAQTILSVLALVIATFPAFAKGETSKMLQQTSVSTVADIYSTGSTNVPSQPNATCPADGQCFADVLPGTAFYTFTNRIFQQDLVTGFPCGGPGEPCDSDSRPYYRPGNDVTRQQMAKFIDNARRLPGISIDTNSNGPMYVRTTANNGYAISGLSVGNGGVGVSGEANANADSIGVIGNSVSGTGVSGSGHVYGVHGRGVESGLGVLGEAGTGPGVNGVSGTGNGVVGYNAAGTGYGIYGYSGGFRAGYFSGSVQVTGSLSKGAGSFKIDDPLDPANKYLYHSFVESPDMMNVYNGNVTLDSAGEAVVEMPAYFELLNMDFRYQLTPMGAPGPNLYLADEIKDRKFKIAGGKPGSKVSWQVTGIRHDPYANAHRIPIEEEKPANEQGKYLHPTERGLPVSLGVDYEQQQKIEQAAAQAQSKP